MGAARTPAKDTNQPPLEPCNDNPKEPTVDRASDHAGPLRVATWNIGGAKFLEAGPDKRQWVKARLNDGLRKLVDQFKPHIVLLQEVVKFGEPGARPATPLDPLDDYHLDVTVSIDTLGQSHPRKWAKYYHRGAWSPNHYLAQGYGMLWRRDLAHAPMWDFAANTTPTLEREVVRLDTGLFTGTRDSEPRLAVVSHFVVWRDGAPLDLFTINLHLTTLVGEREGLPRVDSDASILRLGQLDTVLHGIVSRYNAWFARNTKGRRNPLWIIGGDLNCLPESEEIRRLKALNFIDLNPHKGRGSKGSGYPEARPTITLDYLFAGPAYVALDPVITAAQVAGNPGPLAQLQVSDHFPVFAEIPLP